MDINSILKEIDSLKEKAELLKPHKPEYERAFWEKFRLEFNYNSNHIEGNTLTYGQTKLLLLFDRTTGDNKGREIEEMKAHDVALKMITELSADEEERLTEKLIKEINEIILVRPYYNDAITPTGQPTKRLITPGKYKEHPNSVLLPDGNMFYYASPEETPGMMGDLIQWFNDNKEKIHPVRLAALMHYKLVRIHPFDDSNGRTTRLIMNFILMQNGYAPVVIESKKKEAYLAALNKADVGDIGAFEEYIAGISLRWQEIFLKAMKAEKIEEEGDFEKEVEIFKRSRKEKEKLSDIQRIYENSFVPLIAAIKRKIKPLEELYYKISEKTYATDTLGNDYEIDTIINPYTKVFKDNYLTISFSQTHTELKTSDNKIKYSHQIYFSFKENNYDIVIYPTGLVIEKNYLQNLTKIEIAEIADNIAKEEFLFIKEKY